MATSGCMSGDVRVDRAGPPVAELDRPPFDAGRHFWRRDQERGHRFAKTGEGVPPGFRRRWDRRGTDDGHVRPAAAQAGLVAAAADARQHHEFRSTPTWFSRSSRSSATSHFSKIDFTMMGVSISHGSYLQVKSALQLGSISAEFHPLPARGGRILPAARRPAQGHRGDPDFGEHVRDAFHDRVDHGRQGNGRARGHARLLRYPCRRPPRDDAFFPGPVGKRGACRAGDVSPQRGRDGADDPATAIRASASTRSFGRQTNSPGTCCRKRSCRPAS